MTTLIKEYETRKHVLRIHQDVHCESPRISQDNLGVIVTWHPKYTIGDINISKDAVEKWIENLPPRTEKFPVYLYDHSGLSIKTSSFNDPWDSMQVGIIYASEHTIKEEYGDLTDESRVKARNVMLAEIAELDLYLRGQCFGYRIVEKETCAHCNHTEEVEVGGCWGFITENILKDVLEILETDGEFKELIAGIKADPDYKGESS